MLHEETCVIGFCHFIIFHPIFGEETAVGPICVQINIAWQFWSFQGKVNLCIFAGVVVFYVVAVADIKRTFGSFIVNVIGARAVRHYFNLIVASIPIYGVYSHGWMVGVQKFKLSVFVARIENQSSHMLPTHFPRTQVVGFRVDDSIVPSSVLKHYDVQLVGMSDSQLAVIQFHFQLLMVLLDIYICC